MAIYNPPSVNAVQKTLAAELLTGVTATMTLNNTTNIVDGIGVVVVDRVDANGNSTANKREYVSFTGTSGSTLTGLTRSADGGGADQDHAVGAIVEFVSDVVQAKEVKDIIETEHSTAGAHTTDVIAEKTGAAGVTVDSVLLKDGTVTPGSAGRIRLAATSSELTISSGVLTITGGYHTVLGEGAANDALATVTGGEIGCLLLLRQADNTQDITIEEGGNIKLTGGTPVTLINVDSWALLAKSSANQWLVVATGL